LSDKISILMDDMDSGAPLNIKFTESILITESKNTIDDDFEIINL